MNSNKLPGPERQLGKRGQQEGRILALPCQAALPGPSWHLGQDKVAGKGMPSVKQPEAGDFAQNADYGWLLAGDGRINALLKQRRVNREINPWHGLARGPCTWAAGSFPSSSPGLGKRRGLAAAQGAGRWPSWHGAARPRGMPARGRRDGWRARPRARCKLGPGSGMPVGTLCIPIPLPSLPEGAQALAGANLGHPNPPKCSGTGTPQRFGAGHHPAVMLCTPQHWLGAGLPRPHCGDVTGDATRRWPYPTKPSSRRGPSCSPTPLGRARAPPPCPDLPGAPRGAAGEIPAPRVPKVQIAPLCCSHTRGTALTPPPQQPGHRDGGHRYPLPPRVLSPLGGAQHHSGAPSRPSPCRKSRSTDGGGRQRASLARSCFASPPALLLPRQQGTLLQPPSPSPRLCLSQSPSPQLCSSLGAARWHGHQASGARRGEGWHGRCRAGKADEQAGQAVPVPRAAPSQPCLQGPLSITSQAGDTVPLYLLACKTQASRERMPNTTVAGA